MDTCTYINTCDVLQPTFKQSQGKVNFHMKHFRSPRGHVNIKDWNSFLKTAFERVKTWHWSIFMTFLTRKTSYFQMAITDEISSPKPRFFSYRIAHCKITVYNDSATRANGSGRCDSGTFSWTRRPVQFLRLCDSSSFKILTPFHLCDNGDIYKKFNPFFDFKVGLFTC